MTDDESLSGKRKKLFNKLYEGIKGDDWKHMRKALKLIHEEIDEQDKEAVKKLKEHYKEQLKETNRRYDCCMNKRTTYYKFEARLAYHEIEFWEDAIKEIDKIFGKDLI